MDMFIVKVFFRDKLITTIEIEASDEDTAFTEAYDDLVDGMSFKVEKEVKNND